MCGKENPDQARFCHACGASLQTMTTRPYVQQTVASAIPAVYAGFWKRFVAALLDGIVLSIPTFIIFVILGLSFGIWEETEYYYYEETTPSVPMLLAFWLVSPIISWLYYSLMESSSKQATLGKMALGIKVTDVGGNRISFARATGRHFAKILSSLILLVGYIMVAFTEKKQGLHDIVADCLVVVKGA